MKIQPLNDLQKEIDRIFVASSRFAKGDPRLLKQIPVFEKLGQKAPIFLKLKDLLVELTTTDEEHSEEKLLETSILMYSILNTLSDSIEINELTEINTQLDNNQIKTYLPYSKLKNLQGMFDCTIKYDEDYIKKACDDGELQDLRIIEYIANSLNLTNIYLSQFVENYVSKKIPMLIFPYIYKDFNLKGAKKDATKFRIINNIDEKVGKELIDKILVDGSSDIKIEAIKILGTDIKNEKIILSLLKEKKKDIIDACTYELCKMNSKEGIKKALDLFKTVKYSYVIRALNICKDESIFDDLFKEVKSTYKNFIENSTDPKAINNIEKLGEIFEVLENKNNEEKIYEFVLEVMKNKELLAISKKGYEVKTTINSIMLTIEKFKDIKYITNMFENKKLIAAYPIISEIYFKAVSQLFDKEKIFDIFSKQFENNNLAVELFNVYKLDTETERVDFNNYYIENLDPSKIDSRFTILYLNKLLNEKTATYNTYPIIFFLKSVIDYKNVNELNLLYKYFLKCTDKKAAVNNYLGTVCTILLNADYKNIGDDIVKAFINNQYVYSIINDLDSELLVNKISKDYEQTFRDLHAKTKSNYFLIVADGLLDKK